MISRRLLPKSEFLSLDFSSRNQKQEVVMKKSGIGVATISLPCSFLQRTWS